LFVLEISLSMVNFHSARIFMPPDPSKASDPYLDLEEENPEDLGEEVQKTNTELEKLKRQLEDIEKQKLRLEELKKRQDELEVGRSEMADKLTRSLVTVQREAEEAQKRLEQLNSIHNSFTQHLRHIEAINPKAWGAADLPKELSKALSAVEDARVEYVKAQAKIAAEGAPDSPVATGTLPSSFESYYGDTEERGFKYWMKSGFAFTLPIQILGLVALAIWAWSIFGTN
jgi:septal ring factor EnvC (AmiA/AmiB activator)